MEIKRKKNVPEIKGILRSNVIEVPSCIRDCSGIKIFGKRLKSFLFTTDPFTPQPLITEALVMAADVPIFCGVGGGITQGKRVVNLGLDAEFKGAMGVVVNAPTSNEIVKNLRETIDIPIIVTVVSEDEDIKARIESGATILNVSGGKNTAAIVRKIKSLYPDFPVLATGGPTEETIRETIEAGANAITYTPPYNGEIMSALMDRYRDKWKSSSKLLFYLNDELR